MKISRKIVNRQKSNNYVLEGIRAIVCVQKPPQHFLQTLHYACLRLCCAIVQFVRNNCL